MVGTSVSNRPKAPSPSHAASKTAKHLPAGDPLSENPCRLQLLSALTLGVRK